MTPFDNEKVKGAIKEEAEIRDGAFLGVSGLVEGQRLRPFSLRHYLSLYLAGNQFVTGGLPTATDAAVFLWVVSGSTEDQSVFAQSIADLDFDKVCRGILDFINEAFFDAPPATPGMVSASYYSLAASLVDTFGREYGWTIEQTMNAPLGVLFQLLKVMQRRTNPDVPLFNPISDKALLEAAA
jgi:hypothetical protein